MNFVIGILIFVDMIYGLNKMISSADREMPGLKRIMKTFTFGQEVRLEIVKEYIHK